MEQAWNSFFFGVQRIFVEAASPFVALSRWVGLELTPAQVWMLVFTLLFVGYAAVFLYAELILSRRGVRAVGTVIDIYRGDETANRPIIQFHDQAGKAVVFTSHLGVNAATGMVGAKVDIIFDPQHPKRAREVGRTGAKTVHLVVLAFFIAFMIFGTMMAKDAIH